MSDPKADRRFVILAIIAILLVLIAACAPAPTPVPTAVPPTAAPKPTEAPQATAAAQPTSAPKPTEAPKATAAPTAAPKAAVNWPTKDINLIVPASPGGGFDTQSRIFAPIWQKHLPRQVNVIVTNVPGAGNRTGTLQVMRSPADGYTVGTFSSTGVALMQVNGELAGTKDMRDYAWVASLSWDPGVVVVSTASGIKTIQDLVNYPKEVRIGVTEDSTFQAAVLTKLMGFKARRILFDGTADQTLSTMRGDTDLMIDSWTSMKKAVGNSEGKIIPLFAVSDTRLPGWRDIPCSKELGIDLSKLAPVAGSMRTIAGPVGIPPDVFSVMEETAAAALADPEYKATMEKAGYDSSFAARGQVLKGQIQSILDIYTTNKDLLTPAK